MSESSSQNLEKHHSIFFNGIKLRMAKNANGFPWLVFFLCLGLQIVQIQDIHFLDAVVIK